MLLIYLALFVSNPQKDKAKIIVEAQNNEEYWVTLHLYTHSHWSDAPCYQNGGKYTKGKRERNASYLQKYLFATNKTYKFVLSFTKSIRKIYKFLHISQYETDVQE